MLDRVEDATCKRTSGTDALFLAMYAYGSTCGRMYMYMCTLSSDPIDQWAGRGDKLASFSYVSRHSCREGRNLTGSTHARTHEFSEDNSTYY